MKEELVKNLHDMDKSEEEIMLTLNKQQQAKRKIVKFLRMELGLEAIFQIAGKAS